MGKCVLGGWFLREFPGISADVCSILSCGFRGDGRLKYKKRGVICRVGDDEAGGCLLN